MEGKPCCSCWNETSSLNPVPLLSSTHLNPSFSQSMGLVLHFQRSQSLIKVPSWKLNQKSGAFYVIMEKLKQMLNFLKNENGPSASPAALIKWSLLKLCLHITWALTWLSLLPAFIVAMGQTIHFHWELIISNCITCAVAILQSGMGAGV